MRIRFNAPFILSFTLLAMVMAVLSGLNDGFAWRYLMLRAPLSIDDPWSLIRMVTYTLGHADLAHFSANFAIILLVGPLVEESYGSWRLLAMTLITALVSALLHVWLFPMALIGASGIAFMLILLGSLLNAGKGTVPITFILVFFIYLGNECLLMFEQDNVARLTHIAGGLCGALFGLMPRSRKKG
jgi:rhomboid protease GluP